MNPNAPLPLTLFMTGATSGLGRYAAQYFANQGATVVVMTRDLARGKHLHDTLYDNYPAPKGRIDFVQGDLSSFQSVTEACREAMSRHPHIDQFIFNAGTWNNQFRLSTDGIEETLQVNILSHLLCCHLLVRCLPNNGTGKIIFTSSGLHQGDIRFHDLEMKQNYSGFKVYRQSKLGLIMLAKLLALRLTEQHISVFAQHPGIVRSRLGRKAGWMAHVFFRLVGKGPAAGARNLIHLVKTPNAALENGAYYAGLKAKETPAFSQDMAAADRLLKACRDYLDHYAYLNSLIFPPGEGEQVRPN